MPTTINGNTGVSQVQDGSITQSDLATAILPLGVGQNWVNVLGIRAINTDYSNDTGRPIQVVAAGNAAGVAYTLRVAGVPVSTMTQVAGSATICSGIVPSGATYRLEGSSGVVSFWAELR
jgi:hypothetical protein